MSSQFDGKVAIITGSSNGLGTAYAKYLAARRARVIVNGTSDITEQEAKQLEEIAPARKVAPVVAWLAQEDVFCSGEIFSVCNDNVTRVFLGDSAGHRYTEFRSMEDCIRRTMNEESYMVPRSIGDFFGTHLGKTATHQLSEILKKHRYPPAALPRVR